MNTDKTSGDGTAAPSSQPTESDLPTAAEVAHLDGLLMSELNALNILIERYVVLHYGADAGQADPVPIAEERALANSVAAAAKAISSRARRRELLGEVRR